MKLQDQIKEAREISGLTQTELAEQIGLSGHNIISYFEGGTKTPSIRTLRKMCDVLNCHFIIRKEENKIEFRKWNEIIG